MDGSWVRLSPLRAGQCRLGVEQRQEHVPLLLEVRGQQGAQYIEVGSQPQDRALAWLDFESCSRVLETEPQLELLRKGW